MNYNIIEKLSELEEMTEQLAPEADTLDTAKPMSFALAGSCERLQIIPVKNILIIQTSPMHTASTLLVNALYGIIEELKDKKIIGTWSVDFKDNFNNIIVLKSHDIDIDNLIEKYKNDYEVYFVCSERAEKNLYIDSKYKLYNNVITFDYIELYDTSENTISNIISNIYTKVHKLLYKYTESNSIKLNKETGIQRIINMNIRYDEIKNMSFNYIDEFYEIHGSHRNRMQLIPEVNLIAGESLQQIPKINSISASPLQKSVINNTFKLHSLKKTPKLKF